MVNYLIKLLILSVFSFIIIFYYYSNGRHIENFDWYTWYTLIMFVIYWIYKYIQYLNNINWKTFFTPLKIFLFFLIHLFILCFLFFSLNWAFFWSWFILFFKILMYLLLPIIIIFISTWFWKKILSYIPNINNQSYEFSLITSIWVWFFSFLFLLSIFWFLWLYNLYIVFWILFWFTIFSFCEIKKLFIWLYSKKIEIDINEWFYLKLITAEIFFLIWTLVLSVSMINIVRPFPIWWDDLWAYMNFPRITAELWWLSSIWGMFSWQTLTWIWYMFNSPVQAFFFNNIWWVLSYILLILITYDLLKNDTINNEWNWKIKNFINIPLLIATIFISMPMIVFQQAKDMKLDIWLFFISIIPIYLVYKYYNSKNKLWIFLLLIIWILAWFAFTIKVTSLMLILWIIWVIFYSRLWFFWFLWYISIFFSVFTKLNLWDKLNIVYPKNDLVLINKFSIITFWLWLFFLIYSFIKDKINFKKVFLEFSILFLWIILALLPWITKNFYASYPDFSINHLIWWKSKGFIIDYEKIYTKKELEEKNNKLISWKLNSLWTTKNEDMWRYFWYEEWINNYVKLPWNLTMQSNQWWEFTDIWYILLALLPAIFLFLPYKKYYYSYVIILFLLLEILLYILLWSRLIFTMIMSNITLPSWYTYIFAAFLLPLIFLINWLKKSNKLFKQNLIFWSLYTFIWVISAFWILWYWIAMFFSFLLMIALWIYNLSSYSDTDELLFKRIKLFWSIIIIIIVWIYFTNSVYPHTFNNLKNASYKEYKTGDITTDESPFMYHKEYLPILFDLNIIHDKKIDFLKNNIDESLIQNFNVINDDIYKVIKLLREVALVENKKPKNETEQKIFNLILQENLQKKAKISLQKIYSWIISPPEEYKNTKWIYRIGTFLKYFILENNTRLFEDSLIISFDNYLFNNEPNKTIENMKKMWVEYLLVDLNAATIDKDARHALTKRYEKLLFTFTSDNLELVETDSVCLKVALESYKKSEKTDDDKNIYLTNAWVNYESYLLSWKTVWRSEKQLSCFLHIFELIKDNKIDNKNYIYLLPYKMAIENNQNLKEDKDIIFFLQEYINHWFKVLFRIK